MTLSVESAERIALLYRAAKRNGSLVSVQELTRLLPQSTSAAEVEMAITSVPQLSSIFELKSGYLTKRYSSPEDESVQLEGESRRTALRNYTQASRLLPYLHTSGFQVVAVSGSTSYGSASQSKDIDLFCVAPAGRMWLSLAKGLVMARVYSVLNRDSSGVCLSCVMDEDSARLAFVSYRHPLFARDALEAKVLTGQNLYSSLMRSANWISEYYPVAYEGAVSQAGGETIGSRPSSFAAFLNRLMYILVGRYILAKSLLLNRKLRSRGKHGDAFSVRHGEDRLVYESRRYMALRNEYEATNSHHGPTITS